MKTLFLLISISANLLIGTAAFSQANEPGSGNCVGYSGTLSDRVTIPDNASIRPPTTLTVEAWVTQASSAGRKTIICKDDDWSPNTSGYHLWIQNDRAVFGVGDNANNGPYVTSSSILALNTWYHITGVYEGATGNLTLYINGVLDNINNSAPSSIVYEGWDLIIGRFEADHILYPYNGMIDEVRIWNNARSQTQIREDMCQKLTGSETGLVGYWRLDEGSGNTAFDSSPNLNDGTLQ